MALFSFSTKRSLIATLLLLTSFSVVFAGTKSNNPRNLKAEVISTSQVKISWEGTINDQSYNVREREAGSNEWTTYTVTAPTTNRRITGLKPSATYEWQVQAIGRSKSDFIAGEKFITFSNCDLPADYTVQSSGLTSATLSWAYNAGMEKYEIRVKPIDGDTWQDYFTEYTSLSISNLVPYTEYEWQVRSFCADNAGAGSAFSASESFSTQSYLQADLNQVTIDSKSSTGNNREAVASTVLPSNNYVKMINTMGQTVQCYPISYTDDEGGVYFDMSNRTPAGLYFIQVPAELHVSGQKILVK